ncbi:hypothetical protein HK096_004365, partial [Nowakowskiella sp. JEL0078]
MSRDTHKHGDKHPRALHPIVAATQRFIASDQDLAIENYLGFVAACVGLSHVLEESPAGLQMKVASLHKSMKGAPDAMFKRYQILKGYKIGSFERALGYLRETEEVRKESFSSRITGIALGNYTTKRTALQLEDALASEISESKRLRSGQVKQFSDIEVDTTSDRIVDPFQKFDSPFDEVLGNEKPDLEYETPEVESEVIFYLNKKDKVHLEEEFLKVPTNRVVLEDQNEGTLDLTATFFQMVRDSIRQYNKLGFRTPFILWYFNSLSKIFIVSETLPTDYEISFSRNQWKLIRTSVQNLEIAKYKNAAKYAMVQIDDAHASDLTSLSIDPSYKDYNMSFALAAQLLFFRVEITSCTDQLKSEPTYGNRIIDSFHQPVQVASKAGKNFHILWFSQFNMLDCIKDKTSPSSKNRDTLLFSNKGPKRIDCIYMSNGVEIGGGEFKPFGYTELEKNEDLVKLAHQLKNQIDHMVVTLDIPVEDDVEALGWQATGNEVVFYSMMYEEGMNRMVEIGRGYMWHGVGDAEVGWRSLALFEAFSEKLKQIAARVDGYKKVKHPNERIFKLRSTFSVCRSPQFRRMIQLLNLTTP